MAYAEGEAPTCDLSEDRCWKELGERNQQLEDARGKITELEATIDRADEHTSMLMKEIEHLKGEPNGKLLQKVVDLTWGRALEDCSVPSTKIADQIIANAMASL